MEIPRLGIEPELQLPACATALPDLSHICDLHHSSWQCQLLNPLNEARGQTQILMDTGLVRFHWAITRTPTATPYFRLLILCVLWSIAVDFDVVRFAYFCCCLWFWCHIKKKIIAQSYVITLSPKFASRSFIVFALGFRSMISAELTFVCGIR